MFLSWSSFVCNNKNKNKNDSKKNNNNKKNNNTMKWNMLHFEEKNVAILWESKRFFARWVW